MHPVALRALEVDRIREMLAREACTPLGRARALTLAPATETAEVRAGLELAAEASRFVRDAGSLALVAPEDLPDILERLRLGPEPLEPLALLGLAGFVDSLDSTARAIRGAAEERGTSGTSFPRLAPIAARAPSFRTEAAAIRRAIEPGGDLHDDASPALREIRDGLRRQRAKLRSTLEGLTRGRETSRYLQDQIVTDRHGRYVVVVRAEHRGAIPGLVHGSSASGASLYVEPLATVELNNDIMALVARELEEVRRILLALTQPFRDRDADLASAVDAATVLDELHAKTRLAHRFDGIAPELTDDGRVEFRGARHPLLTGDVAATDLLILPPTRALVISGPNTGGKTVALKAMGLLSIMAQSGILIPVEPGSRFTPFRSIFADIGDDQSIAASLSTFSARIANLVAMDRALELPALVLLDEVGSGTDPAEGGALGAAVIDHFLRRGALVVTTTHDEMLKSYAASTDGVSTAAFGFDPDTYAPTYRLMYGVPGRSLALEISERLGMPASVIADARARRSSRESQLAAHLARVDDHLAALARERADVARGRDELAAERQRLLDRESRLAEREAVLKRRLDDRLNEKLREARAEVDRVVGELKHKAEALADRAVRRSTAAPVLSTGDVGGLRSDARRALEAIGQAVPGGVSSEEARAERLDAPPAPGDTVMIGTLGVEGIVRRVAGERVDVEVRGKRMRVGLGDLRARAAGSSQTVAPSRGHVATPDRPGGATRDLVVIGLTVDEAIDRAGKFLDDALVTDERRLRVVHGHGTGRLREGMRSFFRTHPLVAGVSRAADHEGGDAATIVELKD
jgi:DNA mismatch repair protein MutS2